MQVTLSPAASLSVYRDEDISVNAAIESSVCDDGSTYIPVWAAVSRFPSSVDFKIFSSRLSIPPYTMDAGKTYTVKFTLKHSTDDSRSLNFDYDFSVLSRPLVATISGGSRSLIPILRPFTIDASLSSDPDQPPLNDKDGLIFTWSCFSRDDTDGSTYPCVTASGSILTLPSVAKVTIPAFTLNTTDILPYTFQVQVSKLGRAAVSATKDIDISPDPVPLVSLQPHASLRRKNGQVYVNTNDQVIFRGSCDSSVPASDTLAVEYQWTMLDPDGKSIDTSDAQLFVLGSKSLDFVMVGDSGKVIGGKLVSLVDEYCRMV